MPPETRDIPEPSGRLTLADGRVLAWDEHGDVRGPAVLYLHGTPGCRILWSEIPRMATEAGVRLIMADRPGCGASDFQPGRRITGWPDDVGALADHLRLSRYWVLGASGGGPYALACASGGDPRLVRAAVTSGIGPLDTPEARDRLTDTNRSIFLAAASGAEAAVAIARALTSGGASMAAMIATMPPGDQAIVREHPGMLAELVDLRAVVAHGPEGLAHDLWLATQPWGFDLGGIRIPVDFYAGDEDRNVPVRMVEEQASRVPRSTFTVWPGAGHLAELVRLGEVVAHLVAAD
ncbi:alpha/beta fold hydrolase [Amycolatopsis jiangsuensis]|uniref:Pimeloyl-ACP methyl ester carboxylesterase n=1 Tax=Amycolatopsis jiangsuensis TaxID=1181879 RepID=A0A840IMI6_9PSEU|nr:alpha/beta hydrolase [Amycolatopsis jiangsuensis]MBB4683160.1 pimeloyl-ACP methyl ester carboxylesterase [Amycolatopsis jiangsuensis]